MILADLINIIVGVVIKFFASWLTQQLLSLFGVSSSS